VSIQQGKPGHSIACWPGPVNAHKTLASFSGIQTSADRAVGKSRAAFDRPGPFVVFSA